jgi:hypothetical protein
MAFLVCVAAAERAPAQAPVAPDAPRPAPTTPKQKAVTNLHELKRPVGLVAVTVGRLTPAMERLAGPEFVKTASDPLFIEVKTAPGALGKPPMASMPVIVLNGEPLLDTRGGGPDTLVSFLADRGRIKDTNSVAVVWLGRQERTMTERPLTFRRGDIRQ